MGIQWERVNNHGELEGIDTYRARVTGQKGELGWLVLVRTSHGPSITFVADADGIWDGNPFQKTAYLPQFGSATTK